MPKMGFIIDKNSRTVTANIEYHRQYGSNFPTNGKIEPEDTLGIQTYKKMMKDETIRENHEFVSFSVLSRIGEYHHDNPNIKDFILAAFEGMRGSIYDVFREMLFGIPFGFSIGEPTYVLDGRTAMLAKVDFYDPETVEFKVVTKPEAEQGVGLPGDLHPTEGIKQTGTGASGYIPSSKAIVYVPDKKWGNWYGSPSLRGAYKWWNFTEMVPRWYAISLERYSIPILKATVSEALYNQTISKDGVTYGPSEKLSVLDLAVKILDEIYGGKNVSIPEGITIDQITANSQISADFKGAIDFANKMKNRAQLIPDLLAGQGTGTGTYAMADAHQEFYFQLVDWRVTQVTELMLDSVVRFLIEANFGPQDGWGIFQRRNPGKTQLEVEANVVKALTETGYLDPVTHGDMVRQRLEFEDSIGNKAKGSEPALLPRNDEASDTQPKKLADDESGDVPILDPSDIPEEAKPILELSKVIEERALKDLSVITQKQVEALVKVVPRARADQIPDLELQHIREYRKKWADHLIDSYKAFQKQAVTSLPVGSRPKVDAVAKPVLEAMKRKAYVIADGITDDLKQGAKEILLKGIEEGKAQKEIVFDLQQMFEPYISRPDVQESNLQKATKLTERVRTTLTDVASDARLDIGKQASNVVAYRYVGVDDDRQSPVCRELDGMVLAVDDPLIKVIKPANHWHCRSILSYVLRGEAYELTPRDRVMRAIAKIPARFR